MFSLKIDCELQVCLVDLCISRYLEISRFFTIVEKKVFSVASVSDSVFKILLLSIIKILSLMYDSSDREDFTC